MPSLRMVLFALIALLAGCAQVVQTTGNMATLASRDGDWFIFLESGKPTPPDKDVVAKMQAGHIANFGRLFAEQKLFAAGPLVDPSGAKRGIVVVRAPNRDALQRYFDADEYVRDGYLTLNARRAVVNKPLNTVGIDPKAIEEVRIILVGRPSLVLDTDTESNAKAFLQQLVDAGVVGAWYTIEDGPVSEILFSRMTDLKRLEETFASHPSAAAMGLSITVWRQWLSKGVVR